MRDTTPLATSYLMVLESNDLHDNGYVVQNRYVSYGIHLWENKTGSFQ